MNDADRPIMVLFSFGQPRPTTNPYITQMMRAVRSRADVETFSWRKAFTGEYDVFHLHWPEVLMRGKTQPKQAARTALFALLMARLKLSRTTAVVRTIHNVTPHEDLTRVQAGLQRRLDRRTDYWIRLNPHTPSPAPGRTATIPHGHYTNWFAQYDQVRPEPGRAVMFGQLRRYKGVEDLIATARGVTREDFRLLITGGPYTPEYGAELSAAAKRDARVEVRLGFVEDPDLAIEVGRASLVVLPYLDMLNSGALILALSLGRPVLVPRNPANDDLAAEVGEAWVQRYEGDVTPQAIESALAAADELLADPASAPNLSSRGWAEAGAAHLAAYRTALRNKHRH